jgi:ELWxxDGT repeat protein
MLEEGSATYTYIDINPNTGSNPNSFVDFNGKIYFVATSENNGSELHKYDPDTRLVTRVTDISVGADNSLINDPTAYYDGSNTYLVFGASNNGAAGGSQFWYMDTAEQLNSITINNTKNSSPSSFVIDGTSLYFRADRTNQDLDIFVWNGPDGDDPLPAEADPSVDMNLQDGLYIFQDQIIFRAALDGSDYELLRFPLSSSPSESAPELYNLSAEATGSESATFYTDLYSGNASTTYSFFIGLSSNSYIDQESATISGSSSTVNVGIDATTLTPNEQYFVRASATNSVTWTQSDEVSFWTLETEPENHAEIGQVGEELTSISLTFSSADEIGADGYVLIRSSTAFDADDLPNDSQTYTENNTIGDAIVIEVIDITSTTTTLLEDLTSEKSWQFALVPYNIGDDNATINYFTDDIDSISGYTIPTLGEWLLVFGGSLLVIGVWFSRRTV